MSFEELKGLKGVKMFSELEKPVGFFDTGLAGLNYIISGSVSGGLPFGRMVEMFGKESCGKSTIGYSAISKAQQNKYIPYLLDTEGAFDESQADRCGIDPNTLIYDEPKNVDELFKKVYMVLNEVYNVKSSKTPMLIVWDSVAASSLLEDEKSFDSGAAAQLARKISPHVNKIMPLIVANPVSFLCINQIRMNLSNFRPVEDTPGGKTIKFYASIRLDIRRKADWKDKDGNVLGINSEIKCVKNKITRPYLSTSVNIGYDCGVEPLSSLFDLGLLCGAIKQSGSRYVFNNESKYKVEWLHFMSNDIAVVKSMEDEINKCLDTSSSPSTPVDTNNSTDE